MIDEQKGFLRGLGVFFAIVIAITAFCYHSNITERSIVERNYIENFTSYEAIKDGCLIERHEVAKVQEEQNGKRITFTIDGRPDKTQYFINKDMSYSKVFRFL